MPPIPFRTGADLLDWAAEAGLLDPPVRASELPPAAGADPRAALAWLADQGRLTRFQVAQILAGGGGRLVLRQYVLLDQLGVGGMGEVFRARHRMLNRVDAIKRIRPNLLGRSGAVQRFLREAQAAARVVHPNLIQVYDADRADDSYYIAMEYVPGPDLARVVAEAGPRPYKQACGYVRQAAAGLHAAHEAGLVHRDIKPANLLLAGPFVKVTDLGLAMLGDAPTEAGLTAAGVLLGTPDFLPPEQARDARHVDRRADVYGLGCVLYYLISGQPPFPGGSLLDKARRHEADPLPPLRPLFPEVPEEVDAVIAKMTAKNPAERYQTALAAAEALGPFAPPDPGSGIIAAPGSRTISDYPSRLAASTPYPQEVRPTADVAPAATLVSPDGPAGESSLPPDLAAALGGSRGADGHYPPTERDGGGLHLRDPASVTSSSPLLSHAVMVSLESQGPVGAVLAPPPPPPVAAPKPPPPPPAPTSFIGRFAERRRERSAGPLLGFAAAGLLLAASVALMIFRPWEAERAKPTVAAAPTRPEVPVALPTKPAPPPPTAPAPPEKLGPWAASDIYDVGPGRVTALALSGDGRRLLVTLAGTTDAPGTARLVRFADGAGQSVAASWPLPGEPLAAAVSPDGRLGAVGCAPAPGESAGAVLVWDLESKEARPAVEAAPGGAAGVAFAGPATLIVVAGDGSARLDGLADGLRRSLARAETGGGGTAAAASADGRTLAAGFRDNLVKVWAWDGQPLGDFRTLGGVRSVDLDAAGARLAVAAEAGGGERLASVWDAATRERVGEALRFPNRGLLAAAFERGGPALLTLQRADGAAQATAWELAAPARRTALPRLGGPADAESGALAASRRRLVAAAGGARLSIWTR